MPWGPSGDTFGTPRGLQDQDDFSYLVQLGSGEVLGAPLETLGSRGAPWGTLEYLGPPWESQGADHNQNISIAIHTRTSVLNLEHLG